MQIDQLLESDRLPELGGDEKWRLINCSAETMKSRWRKYRFLCTHIVLRMMQFILAIIEGSLQGQLGSAY